MPLTSYKVNEKQVALIRLERERARNAINTETAQRLLDAFLAFEADELHRIVDLMRDLRATEARRHVREEIPFFTGPRVQVGDLVATLP